MAKRGLLVLAVLGAAALSCTAPITQVASGVWGGSGALMVAADSGATLQFNCASGRVDEPLDVGTDGAFTRSGTFLRASPVPGSPPDTPHAAVYSGVATGQRVMLVVDVPDLQIHEPAVELVFGSSGQLALCP